MVPIQLDITQLPFAVLNSCILILLVPQPRTGLVVGKLKIGSVGSLLVEDHIDCHPLVLFWLDGEIHQPSPKNILGSLIVRHKKVRLNSPSLDGIISANRFRIVDIFMPVAECAKGADFLLRAILHRIPSLHVETVVRSGGTVR